MGRISYFPRWSYLAFAVLAVALAMMVVLRAQATQVSLSGGGCSGVGNSGRLSSVARSFTVNQCGNPSYRWLHTVMYDNVGHVLDDYTSGWVTTTDVTFSDGSGAVDLIQAGHEICNSSGVCGSSDFATWP
jgi:hypothetical protein